MQNTLERKTGLYKVPYLNLKAFQNWMRERKKKRKKGEKQIKGQKIEVWWVKRGNRKYRKIDFAIALLGGVNISGMGRLSQSIEQYTLLERDQYLPSVYYPT